MKYLFALIFLLAIASVSADLEILDDRWVFYGDTYDREGVVYYVENSGNLEKMLLYVDDTPYILTNNNCKENSEVHEKYCITEAAFDDEKKFENYIKYDAGEELFAFHLVTYTLVPELLVTRTIKPDTIDFDTQSIVTITLENEGEKNIKNIKYTEPIDESLDLHSIDGQIENGSFILELNILTAGNKKVYQYSFKPQDYVTLTLKPEVTYVYDFIRKSVEVTGISVSVNQPFIITRTKSNSVLGVNEDATYSVKIENDVNERMEYTATITLPEGMIIDDLGDFKYDAERTIIKEGSLKTDEEEESIFEFHTPLTGEYPFKLTIVGHISGKTITRYYNEKVVTETEQLEPRIVFSKNNNKITSGNSATVRLYLLNKDADSSYVNIEGVITHDNSTTQVTSDLIVAGEDQVVDETIFIAPEVDVQTNKEFHFSGTYETREGEKFTFEKSLVISILPNKDFFEITHTPSVTLASPGDTVKMEVTVKNNAGRYVFVNMYDTLSGATIFSGNAFAEISLEDEESRNVYLYEFIVPENFTEEHITITTHLQEEELASIQKYETVIQISENLPENETTDVPEIDETDASTQDEDDEEGIFTRLWNWMTGWFN